MDPRNESIVYTSGPTGISKSTDRGESWTSLITTLTQAIVVDPLNSQTLYANPSGVIRRSVDGGTTWLDFSTGLPSGSATFIAADPQVQGTIYTIDREVEQGDILGNAVYKRVGSDPWVKVSTGLPAGSLSFLAIDRNNSSMLYAGGGIGLFKSTNGGASWAAASRGLTGVNPGGIAIDPFDSSHLLTWTNSNGFESTDGGANWVPFATVAGRQAILLAFDAAAPGRIYNSSSDAVERSNDGGKTWFPVTSGLGRTHGDIFIVAPGGSTLYAGGISGGVWVFHYARSRAVSK